MSKPRNAARNIQHETNASGETNAVDQETGEVNPVLDMVDMPELQTESAELPLLTWENTAEVKGGNLTSLGFAKLLPGFKFRGYVVKEDVVDSQFDSSAGKKRQPVFRLYGTARVPLDKSGAEGGFAEAKGMLTIPQYERLREAIDINREAEKKSGKRIAVSIEYIGQGRPTVDANDPTKVKRSGAHLFDVRRIAEVGAAK